MQDPNSSEPRKTLAQRTIELIQTEGQFDMAFWAEGAPNGGASADAPHCGTACCIAGNIAIAAKELGYVPEYDIFGLESTAQFARRVWAAEYGTPAAGALDFFNDLGSDYDEYGREVGGFARGRYRGRSSSACAQHVALTRKRAGARTLQGFVGVPGVNAPKRNGVRLPDYIGGQAKRRVNSNLYGGAPAPVARCKVCPRGYASPRYVYGLRGGRGTCARCALEHGVS